jgi:RHS repeat-associated protein
MMSAEGSSLSFRSWRSLIAGLLVAWPVLPLCGAADKSGVSPSAISLPAGPGSVEGLGESFQPALNTGTARYSVALRLPPGTSGHTSALALVYDGGQGNGPLGVGWALPVGFVQRQCDKGIPRYVDGDNGRDDDLDGEVDEADEVDVFVDESKEELVPQADGNYFCENEGAFIRYRRQADFWEGTLPDGTRLEFGRSPSARVADPATGRVFKWLLERTTDTSGNTIVYAYSAFPGEANRNQKYLTGIAYGPGAPPWDNFHFVRFGYEERPDGFEDGRAGFLVRTGQRLKAVVVGTQGPALAGHLAGDFNGDGTADSLDREYRLTYLDSDSGGSPWSLLHQVTPVGADGASTLPATAFGYRVCNPPDRVSARGQILAGIDEPPWVMDNELVDLVDLNGDGLPDILNTEFGGGAHSGFLNLGETDTPTGRAIRWRAAADVASADGLAWNLNLQSPATVAHLADMDGDGLADLVCKTLLGDVFYFRNEGRLRWGERQAMSVLDWAPLSPFANPNVKTADVDFDKRMDVIQSVDMGGGAAYRVWFNRGQQRYSLSQTVSQDCGFLFAQPGVHVADFNGDRVPDVVRLQPMTLTVTAGLGHGAFAPPIVLRIPEVTLDDDQVARARLEDITGDGLADLVLERAEPDQLWYWVNLGNNTLSRRRFVTDMPTALGQHPVIRWADLNGNGTTDLVYADSAAAPRLRTVDLGRLIGCAPRPNLLTSIDNGIGRLTTIGYEPSTAFALADAAAGRLWPDPMPFPVHVVAAVTNADSLGHAYVTRFRYHDGYYDAEDKEFRGFARVEHIQPGDTSAPTLVTRSHFDTGRDFEAMKGRLLRLTAEQEDGRVFWDETTTWAVPPSVLHTGTNGQTVNFAHPVASTKTILELGQGEPRRLESEFAYDDYGNRTRTADYGLVANGDRQAGGDERVTITEYALNLDRWILRTPKRRETRDAQGSVAARVEYFYDDETFSGNNWGAVTAGNLTLRREWIDPLNPTAYVDAARTKYDAYGNPTLIIDPLAQAPGGTVDTAQGHCSEVVYDGRFQAYPIRETIHIGNNRPSLAVEASYDAGLAILTSSIDFNGQRTGYGYDVFGRLTQLLKPGDLPAYPSVEYEYRLAQPFGASGVVNYVETRLLDRTPGSMGGDRLAHYFRTRSFVDGLGRSLLGKQEAESDPDTGAPRVAVSGAVQFNARSAAGRALNPFYSLNGGTTLEALLAFEDIGAPGWKGLFHDQGNLVALDLAAAQQTGTRFDATLRPVETTHPDGTLTRTAYEPLVTAVYDENDTDPASPHANTPHVFYVDGLGRQIRTDEIVRLNDDGTPAADPRAWTTTFQYDLNDQLTRIVDSQGNVKRMQYDAIKRKTFMDDPDRGTTAYAYDAASNLIRVTDHPGTASEQVTVHTYDGANRILSQDCLDQGRPDLPAHRHPDVAYHYDAPSAFFPDARNLRGRLAWVEDLSGAEFHAFDPRGNPEWKIKRIESLEGPRDFRTAFAYDIQDRLVEFTYPDGTIVTNVYNEANQLTAIPGYLEGLTHLPSGQIQTERLANGVVTEHAYNSRLWQMRLRTQRPGAAPLQDYTYRFDSTGNILEIVDAVGPDNDPGTADQAFDYDCLDRLIRAHSPAYGALHYRYSPIGNLLSQRADSGDPRIDLGEYRYGRRIDVDGAGPHAVTDVAGGTHEPLSIRYDANGNYRQRNAVEFTFDFADRLARARTPSVPGQDAFAAEYHYDYQGQCVLKRVIRSGATNETLYAGPEFETRNDRHLKYVFAGSRRLARIETREIRQPLVPGWNLLAVPAEPQDARLPALLSCASNAWTAAALYDTDSQSWTVLGPDHPAAPTRTVRAGNAFWLQVERPAELRWVGREAEDPPLVLAAGWNLLGTLLGDQFSADQLLPEGGSLGALRTYDAVRRRWEECTRGAPEFLNTLTSLPPATACWLRADHAATLARTSSGAARVLFHHPDHLGSVSALTDGRGATVETAQFFPFGVERSTQPPPGLRTDYRFTDKEREMDTGLIYFGARYYDPSVGRFASVDPFYAVPERLPQDKCRAFLADPQRHGAFLYALNNPLKYTDPNGLDVVLWGISISAGVGLGGQIGFGTFVQGGEEADFGVYVSESGFLGPFPAAAGLSLTMSYNPGTQDDITGEAVVIGASGGPPLWGPLSGSVGYQATAGRGRATHEITAGVSVGSPVEGHIQVGTTEAVGWLRSFRRLVDYLRGGPTQSPAPARPAASLTAEERRAFQQAFRQVVLRSIVDQALSPVEVAALSSERYQQWAEQTRVLNQWYWQLGGTQEEYDRALDGD